MVGRTVTGLLLLLYPHAACGLRVQASTPARVFGWSVARPSLLPRVLPKAVAASSAVEEDWQRRPYLLTGKPRPLWRGRMMGWCHANKSWYLLVLVYTIVASQLGRSLPGSRISGPDVMLRVLASAASSANVFLSDRYHNSDQRGGKAYTREAELTHLRYDYVGISSLLTTLLWLWSSNVGWCRALPAVGRASGLATALIAVLSATVVPRKAGHSLIKVILGVQFVGMLGYLVSRCVLGSACAVNALIFVVYAPGLILYVLQRPKHPVFGFHEWFHTSVLAGHVASMAFDLADIVSPCARCAGTLTKWTDIWAGCA